MRAAGMHNFVDAGIQPGVHSCVFPRVIFAFADGGDCWLDTETADLQPTDILRSTLAGEADVARFAAGGSDSRGVSLRLAGLDWPQAASTGEHLGSAGRNMSFLSGSPPTFPSMLRINDAASRLVAVLNRAPSGIFDVADDEFLPHRGLNAMLAPAADQPRLRPVPAPIVPSPGG